MKYIVHFVDTGKTVNLDGEFNLENNFKVKEFASPDSSTILISKRLVYLLQAIRNITGRIVITSGFRTIEHNKKVGGVKSSYHMDGLAVDIKSYSKKHLILAIELSLMASKMVGYDSQIITYAKKSHVHVAIGVPHNWLYCDEKGDYGTNHMLKILT